MTNTKDQMQSEGEIVTKDPLGFNDPKIRLEHLIKHEMYGIELPGNVYVEALDMVLAYINELEAENERLRAEVEQHRWIPVGERLPQNKETVTIFIEPDIIDSAHYSSESGWWTADGVCQFQFPVTHWKPIIAPEVSKS